MWFGTGKSEEKDGEDKMKQFEDDSNKKEPVRNR